MKEYKTAFRRAFDLTNRVVFHPTRFASPQERLIPLTPWDSSVVRQARASRRRLPQRSPMQQLVLFEVVLTG
jgi:hypothetical protein